MLEQHCRQFTDALCRFMAPAQSSRAQHADIFDKILEQGLASRLIREDCRRRLRQGQDDGSPAADARCSARALLPRDLACWCRLSSF